MLEKTLESPLDSKEIKQSLLKDVNPEYSLEGLMLKLKLQYFGQLMQRADSFEKTLMLGKIEDGRRGGAAEDEMAGWHHRLNGRGLSVFIFYFLLRNGIFPALFTFTFALPS